MMEMQEDPEECREWTASRCGAAEVTLADGSTGKAFVHHHFRDVLRDEYARVTGPDPAGKTETYGYCRAKNRRANSTAVHAVIVDGWPDAPVVRDHADCGSLAGEMLSEDSGDERPCWGCLNRPGYYAPPPADEGMRLRYAEQLASGVVAGHFLRRHDGKTDISFSPPAVQALDLVRAVPGRKYEVSSRTWVIPSVHAGALVADLRSIGVVMREAHVCTGPGCAGCK